MTDILNPKRKYYCPRCGNEKIVDYGETFDCPKCKQRFEKEDFNSGLDDDEILSVEEKLEFSKIFDSKTD